MKTLAIIARKGGTGKTTLAVHLAAAAHASGYATLLADTDRQHSAVEWRRLRQATEPAVEAVKPGALFARQQDAARAGVGLMVIDTGPSVEEEVEQAVRCADLCLVVARPNFFDIRAVAESAALAARFHKPVAFVLNQAPHRQQSIEAPVLMEAVSALRALGFPVAPIGLRTRVAYQRSVAGGSTAQDMEPSSSAAGEITALWSWIEARLLADRPIARTPMFVAATDRQVQLPL